MTSPLIATSDRPYQLLPPLSATQRDLLRDSIKENGVLDPVVFDEEGEILDGHHRVEIAEELGIEYPRRVIEDLDRPGKHMYALTVNVARRQLDAAARGPLVAQMRLRGMSIREIARVTGVSPGTVHSDLQVFSSEHLPEKVTGTDGKEYASSRPAPPKPDLAPTILDALAAAGRDGLDAKDLAAAWPEPPADKDLLRALEKLTKSGEVVVTRTWANGKPRKWASAAVFGDLTPDIQRILTGAGAAGRSAWQVAFLIDSAAPPSGHVMEILGRMVADGHVLVVGGDADGSLYALTELVEADPETPEEESAELPPPSALAVTPEERQRIVDEGERQLAINNAHKKADRLVREVSGLITEIEAGVLYGEPDLITPEMVAGLREQADRLERYLKERK